MTCLIMQEIGKLDVRISVIPNGLEKYKSFTINKNLFFIDNMHAIYEFDGNVIYQFIY